MIPLITSYYKYSQTLLTWLQYHIRQGFTDVYVLSFASYEDNEKLIHDVKSASIKNINLIKVNDQEVNDILQILYSTLEGLKYMCYIPMDERLVLLSWKNIDELINDTLFKNQKQIIIPVIDNEGNTQVEHVRNMLIGGCKTRKPNTEAILNSKHTGLLNGQSIKLKSFEYSKINFPFDKAYILHQEMTNDVIYTMLSTLEFSTIEELYRYIPDDLPIELTNNLKYQNGFINDGTKRTQTEYPTVGEVQTTPFSELNTLIKSYLNKEYASMAYIDADHEIVLFRLVDNIKDYTIEEIDNEFTRIVEADKRKQKEEYKQYHEYPILIKNRLDDLFGLSWVNNTTDTIASYISTAAKFLHLTVADMSKLIKLIMALTKLETIDKEQQETPTIEQTEDKPTDKPVETPPIEQTEDKQKDDSDIGYTAVDINVVNRSLETLHKHNKQPTVSEIQAFAVDEYGLYISHDIIKQILNNDNKKQDNMFDNMKDDDKIVFK